MKKSAFHEGKPRTPRGEARRREMQMMKDIQRLNTVRDEQEFKESLEKIFGITPGHPRYDKTLTIWRELQRGKL